MWASADLSAELQDRITRRRPVFRGWVTNPQVVRIVDCDQSDSVTRGACDIEVRLTPANMHDLVGGAVDQELRNAKGKQIPWGRGRIALRKLLGAPAKELLPDAAARTIGERGALIQSSRARDSTNDRQRLWAVDRARRRQTSSGCKPECQRGTRGMTQSHHPTQVKLMLILELAKQVG